MTPAPTRSLLSGIGVVIDNMANAKADAGDPIADLLVPSAEYVLPLPVVEDGKLIGVVPRVALLMALGEKANAANGDSQETGGRQEGDGGGGSENSGSNGAGDGCNDGVSAGNGTAQAGLSREREAQTVGASSSASSN